ncbi:hypothetical protein DQR70_06325 [Salmonella enterica subsp. enterica serovar Oslo]|nr:hypothetical protein [Salmonella enterica subsp. enterica serovar Oslo]EEX4841926.1 hypothetical protein [Escherichia coli]ELF5187133.1 hypothetical protein [Salmonella enterica]
MIPFDLAKRIILADITAGKTIEEVAAETGFSVEHLEMFFENEVEWKFEEFQKAAGVTGMCITPYYDNILPVRVTFDIARIITDEIDTYGTISQQQELSTNSKNEIFINDSKINVSAWWSYDDTNDLGVLFIVANGFYRDDKNALNELNVYSSVRITEENYHTLTPMGNISEAEASVAEAAFRNIFVTMPNDYRI